MRSCVMFISMISSENEEYIYDLFHISLTWLVVLESPEGLFTC